MSSNRQPSWLNFARSAAAMAQTGLYYAHYHDDPDDRARYEALHQLAMTVFAHGAALPVRDIEQALAVQAGYVTVKNEVRVAVVCDGAVLLVPDGQGRWHLPGGWALSEMTPSGMAQALARAQLGIEGRVARVVGVYDTNAVATPYSLHHAYRTVFLLATVDTPKLGRYFAADSLPPLAEALTTREQALDSLACAADPGRPAVFA